MWQFVERHYFDLIFHIFDQKNVYISKDFADRAYNLYIFEKYIRRGTFLTKLKLS